MLGTNSDRKGTIRAKFPFDDDEAAQTLAGAISSSEDSEKKKLFLLLTQISNAQRQMLRTPYYTKYKKDLMEELKKTMTGDYGSLILALMETATKYDVEQLKKCIKDNANKGSVLIEILCSRTDSELIAIRNEYQNVYGNTLKAEINNDTSGDLKDILITIIDRPVEENNNVPDVSRVKQDVKKILNDKKKPDKTILKNVIASLPPEQLNKFTEEYAAAAGRPLQKDIEKHFSGDTKKALIALIQCSRDSSSYFATLLNNLLKDPEPREQDLTRLIVSRSEIDLAQIREVYSNNYKKALVEEISEKCQGLYCDCLIAIIKGNM